MGIGVVRVATWTFRMGTDDGGSSAGPARVGMREGGPAPWWPLAGGLASLASALTWWAAASPGGMRDGVVVVARVGKEASRVRGRRFAWQNKCRIKKYLHSVLFSYRRLLFYRAIRAFLV